MTSQFIDKYKSKEISENAFIVCTSMIMLHELAHFKRF